MRRRVGLKILTGGLVLLLAADALRAAEPIDILAVRNEAGPKVCLVTVDGPLGLPVAYASGFLLGEGKFVITDLASVARPGVNQITLRFRDGSTAVGRQFGMADPATGLAAILIEPPKTDVGGLGLAAEPLPDGTEVAIVGWKRAQDLDMARGAIKNGASTADLATLARIEPPKVPTTFLTFSLNRVGLATGAPAVDGSGRAIGVLLDLAGVDRTILVPSGLLRSALLSAGARLKPLSELPKPIWPVAVCTLAGKPVNPGEFAQAARTAKTRSRCGECSGRGVVTQRKHVGTERTPIGTVKNIYKDVTETCKACRGESAVCTDGLYGAFANMAYGAAWLAASPDVDPRAKEAAVTNGTTMLKGLARVGVHFRDGFVTQAGADLAKPGGEFPRGIVVYAQVREALTAADGPYRLLAPFRSPALLVVKADLLAPPAGADGKPAGAQPAVGQWIVLGGAAEGVALLQNLKPILVRPFGWAPGPQLHAPPGPGRAPGPADEPPPKKQPGEPDFFGL